MLLDFGRNIGWPVECIVQDLKECSNNVRLQDDAIRCQRLEEPLVHDNS